MLNMVLVRFYDFLPLAANPNKSQPFSNISLGPWCGFGRSKFLAITGPFFCVLNPKPETLNPKGGPGSAQVGLQPVGLSWV